MLWECRMGGLTQQWRLGWASQEGWLWPESAGRVKGAWVSVSVRTHSKGCFIQAGGRTVCGSFGGERGRVLPAGDQDSWSGCGLG